MIKTIKKEKWYLVALFLLISLIALMCFLPSLVKGVPITFGTDIKPQWFEFYTEFKNLIRNFVNEGQLPVYSWNLFLGNNFWASKGYYLIGDIYNYIGLFLSDNFFDMARDLSYLKFLVAGFGFYFYLTEVGRKPLSKLIVSLAYAFSGWAIFFSGQLVFLSFYSFVPYYLWGIERSLNSKGPWIFIISCALLFATNFYFFYTLTIMSPLYYIYRYVVLGLDRKVFIKSVLKQILYYVIGIAITAVFWLPSIFYILSSERFAGAGEGFDINVYLNLFFSAFTPNYLYIYRNNVFETSVHYTREICLWASTSLLVVLPQFWKICAKKERNFTLAAYLIFLIIALIPNLDSAMHGFGDPSFRWVFLIVIFNLFIASKVIDHIDMLDKKLLFITVIIELLMMFGLFFIALNVKDGTLNDYLKQFVIIVVFAIVLMMAGFLVYKQKTKILLALVVAELGFSGMYCYGHDVWSKPDDTYPYMEELTHVIQSYPGEIMDTINSLKEENSSQFIRLYIPLNSIYWNFSHNMSLHYGIKGLMTYDSTYANSFSSMYHMEPSVASFGSGWIFNIEDDNLMSFLNTKYAIVTANDELSDNWVLVDDDYHYGFKIYENTAYRPLATTYSQMMSEEEYKELRDTSIFLDYVVVDEKADIIQNYLSDAQGKMDNIAYYGNYLSAKYHSDKDGFMVMTIPYDKGWKIMVDGEEIEYYDVNGGFIGFAVKAGEHDFAMSFIPEGFKEGLVLSALGSVSFVVLLIYTVIFKKKALK